MAWHIGIAANTIIAVAYAAIAITVFRGLKEHGTLRTNRLAVAVGAIFATCSAGHAGHLLHLLGTPGISSALETQSARTAYDLHIATVDLVTAVVGVTFWSLRAGLTAIVSGPVLFADDMGDRRHRTEVNDRILQPLLVASLSYEDGDVEAGRRSLDEALAASREMGTPLLTDLAGIPTAPVRTPVSR